MSHNLFSASMQHSFLVPLCLFIPPSYHFNSFPISFCSVIPSCQPFLHHSSHSIHPPHYHHPTRHLNPFNPIPAHSPIPLFILLSIPLSIPLFISLLIPSLTHHLTHHPHTHHPHQPNIHLTNPPSYPTIYSNPSNPPS